MFSIINDSMITNRSTFSTISLSLIGVKLNVLLEDFLDI